MLATFFQPIGTIGTASLLVVATLLPLGMVFAGDDDNNMPLPKVVKGKLIDPLAPSTNHNQRPLVEMSSDGSKGTIPITKDTGFYGQKDNSAKEGETKVHFGIQIKTDKLP